MKQPYHYTECGLDNIYLVNGFTISKEKNGDAEIFIQDIQNLHKAIGMDLIMKAGLLSGKEIKFVRATLDLSQKTMAKVLGVDYQSVLGWEKNKRAISKTADHLLKAYFFSFLNPSPNQTVYELLQELSELDANLIATEKKIEFNKLENEWRKVA